MKKKPGSTIKNPTPPEKITGKEIAKFLIKLIKSTIKIKTENKIKWKNKNKNNLTKD